jgi:nicotinate-nucleotide pyrophosphorylase (carboxylating)
LIAEDRHGRATVITREAGVLCGRPWFDEVFRQLDPGSVVTWQAEDGSLLEAGQLLCGLEGSARALLTGERSALNFLQTLSGTATVTRRYVDAIAGTAVPDPRHAQDPSRSAPRAEIRRALRRGAATIASVSSMAS